MSDELETAITRAAELAAPVFASEGWTYGWTKRRVPDALDLADAIRHLVNEATSHEMTPNEQGRDAYWVSSGRFVVSRRLDEDGDELVVVLELGRVDLTGVSS